ncbi:23S rRNA (pseudouridine(1915)-N(3))-methyltransferase RlmH [Candidatus Saccharibacteria bacterium]|nr:23S rRNA (pseudouridine(1915)-N(3))-methyltransferase RlmH [Candidatus Saccharibacteria bacterium]
MKIRVVTIGKPKLPYAKAGWDEYLPRLQRLHQIEIRNISDKFAYDERKILAELEGTTIVALEIQGKAYTSEELAAFLSKRELESKELSFIIGGPEGLPETVRQAAHYRWSLGRLTLPHDLAAVVLLEALYRASTINAHLPYHK